MDEHKFKHDMGATVRLFETVEEGTIVARAEYAHSGEDQYLVRYRAADGRQCLKWWGVSDIG